MSKILRMQSRKNWYNPYQLSDTTQIKLMIMTQSIRHHVVKGIKFLNQKDFYEAHEHFECAWRMTPDDSRELYRALLLISGGFFRLSQNKPDAAKKFFSNALGWLEPFPDHYLNFNVSDLRAYCQILMDNIDQSTPADKIIRDYFQPVKPEDHDNSVFLTEE